MWQYLYKGGELVDPEFWKIWHREFYEHRMPPPISFFSLFPIPKATAVSIGLSKSVTGLENYAKAKSFSSVTTFSGTRDFVYFRGVPTASRWAQAAAAAKVAARYLNIATAAATGADIGTAVYAYYEAFGEYYDRR